MRRAGREMLAALKPFLRIWDKPPDLREPETRFDELRGAFEVHGGGAERSLLRVFARLRRASDQTDIAALLRAKHDLRVVESANEHHEEDARWSQVLDILMRAHAQVPYVPIAEFQRLSLSKQTPAAVAAIASLAEVDAAKGERRARLAFAAWKDVAEGPYRDSVIGLLNVQRLAAGKTQHSGESLGGVLDLARMHGDADLRGLVDFDAVLFRNASAHDGYRVLPGEDAVVVWDRKVP
jgi:hypothetical protein